MISKKKIVLVLLFIAFLTSSFDLLLNIKLYGFSLRFTYLVLILITLLSVIKSFYYQLNKIKFLAYPYFIIWVLILIAFIPNTSFLNRNIGYVVWLLLNTLYLLCLPTFIKNIFDFYYLLRLYIYSFVCISLLGISQFFLALVGINLLIQQWWIPDILPRVNGFSYEPSYFSTYLIIGWAICFYLYIYDIYIIISRKWIQVDLACITIAIILSSSRMGILFIVLMLTLYVFKLLLFSTINLKVKKSVVSMVMVSVIVISSLIGYGVYNYEKISFLLAGTGLFGQSSHSNEGRTIVMKETLDIFFKHPIIGVSLGGVPAARGRLHGNIITTQEEAKEFEGMNIFVEVLAASGLIGFIFFLVYFCLVFYKIIQLSYKLQEVNYDLSRILRVLLISLLSELLILSLNQNILRPYLWIHLAIVNLSYFIVIKYLNERRLFN